jgi:hypothetical protein
MEAISSFAALLAATIDTSLQDSREKSLALTKIEEAVMWANAAATKQRQGGNK